MLASPLAQPGAFVPNSQFELSDTVQIDRADQVVRGNLERAKAYLAARQWSAAVETYRQVMENSGRMLIGVTQQRFISVRDYCHLQLAAAPREALELYRRRVDPLARQWYEEGIAAHDRQPLLNVVEQAFASRWGDRALSALGEMALESGDYAAARWFWERIIPAPACGGREPGWPIPIANSIWRRFAPGWCWSRSWKARRPAPAASWPSMPICIPPHRGRWGAAM